jgi:hypothetical protein
MMEHQREAIARLREYTDEAEQALLIEDWPAASIAVLGCWLASDELQRGMPHPEPAGAGVGFF